MELAKTALFHRKDKSKGNSPTSNKVMEENRLLDPTKSQEHIYSYDTDKEKRSVPNTPGRKPFKIICLVIGVIGIYLFCFSMFLSIRGGYSGKDLNDISSNCRYAMFILSLFVVFMAITGYAGAYTNWKPIILTFSVLAFMGLLGHLYVAKKFLDAVRFAERDLAISWWDIYWDSTRRAIQDKYNCCGYKAYNDLPVVSQFCTLQDVYKVTLYDSKIKDPADVEKNDSYKKHFRGADSVVDGDDDHIPDNDTGGGAAAKPPAAGGDVGGGVAAGGDAGAGAGGDAGGAAGGDAGAGAGGDAGAGAGGDAGGVAKPPAAGGDAGGAAANKPAAGGGAANKPAGGGGAAKAGNAGGAIRVPGAKAVVNKNGAKAIVNKKGALRKNNDTLRRRQDQGKDDELVTPPAIMNAPGCKEFLVPLVKSKLKLVYIFNYLLCTVYIGGIGLSLYYWQNMRKEKEFDEFA